MGKHWTMALGLITNQPLPGQCRGTALSDWPPHIAVPFPLALSFRTNPLLPRGGKDDPILTGKQNKHSVKQHHPDEAFMPGM